MRRHHHIGGPLDWFFIVATLMVVIPGLRSRGNPTLSVGPARAPISTVSPLRFHRSESSGGTSDGYTTVHHCASPEIRKLQLPPHKRASGCVCVRLDQWPAVCADPDATDGMPSARVIDAPWLNIDGEAPLGHVGLECGHFSHQECVVCILLPRSASRGATAGVWNRSNGPFSGPPWS